MGNACVLGKRQFAAVMVLCGDNGKFYAVRRYTGCGDQSSEGGWSRETYVASSDRMKADATALKVIDEFGTPLLGLALPYEIVNAAFEKEEWFQAVKLLELRNPFEDVYWNPPGAFVQLPVPLPARAPFRRFFREIL